VSIFEPRPYQVVAIGSLVEQLTTGLTVLSSGAEPATIRLQAPTGAGKTSIALAALTELVEKNPNKKLSFIWLAPGRLHEQASEDVVKVSAATLTPVTADGLTVIPRNRVLLINWASVNKDKNRLRQPNERGEFLPAIVERTRQADRQIVLVIDESHYAYDVKVAQAAREVISLIGPSVHLAMSATLDHPTCEIRRDDAVREGVLRECARTNIGFRDDEGAAADNLLEAALRKQTDLREKYRQALEQGVVTKHVNPLLVIQVGDSKEGNAAIAQLRQCLIDKGYEEMDVRRETSLQPKFVVWVSDDNLRTANGISGPRDRRLVDAAGIVDVVICKQSIALGWNCPRAQVLYKVRDKSSAPTFDIQTLGRILRMVEPERGRPYEEPFDALNYGYIYTLDGYKPKAEYGGFANAETTLRDGLIPPKIESEAVFSWCGAVEVEDIAEAVCAALDLLPPSALAEQRFDSALIDQRLREGEEATAARDEVTVLRDEYRSEAVFYRATDEIAGSAAEGAMLRGEIYWQLRSRDGAINVPRLQNALSDPDTEFGWKVKMELKRVRAERGLAGRDKKSMGEWTLGTDRYYNAPAVSDKQDDTVVSDKQDDTVYEVGNNRHGTYAYEKCYLLRSRLGPEKKFEEWLNYDSTASCIDWWVKNGNVPGKDFGVVYQHTGDLQTFLPDYILQWKDGTFGFYETKDDKAVTIPERLEENRAKMEALRAFVAKDPDRRECGLVVLRKDGMLVITAQPGAVPAAIDTLRRRHSTVAKGLEE
jgi:hypothetical protein